MKQKTKVFATMGTVAALFLSALAPAGQAAWFNRGHHGRGHNQPLYCLVVHELQMRGLDEWALWLEEAAEAHGQPSCTEEDEIIKS
jgi:hypothetical protein